LIRRHARNLLALLAALLFGALFWNAPLRETAALLALAPALWLALFPALFALSFDALGTTWLGRSAGLRTTWLTLLHARVAAEAVALTLPTGSLLGEGVTFQLLRSPRRDDAPAWLAVLFVRRLLMPVVHLALALAGAAVGWTTLTRLWGVAFGARAATWVLPALLLGLLALVLSLTVMVGRRARRASPLAETTHPILRPFFGDGWNLDQSRQVADELGRLLGSLRRLLPAAFCYSCALLLEAFETQVILSLLGAPIGFAEVLCIETLLSLLRAIFVALPAGLGVQDLGYVAAFAGLGLANASALGPAFVVVKRAKEICWAALGYALLLRHARGVASKPFPGSAPCAAVR